MSSKWNVYKLFKSGKRAKAPLHTFTYDGDQIEAVEQFNQLELEGLVKRHGEKIKKFEFRVVDASVDQDRVEVSPEEQFNLARGVVLSAIIRRKNIRTKRSLSGGLIYAKETGWNWQWAALESGTNKYVEGLSERFNTHKDAIAWMKEQIATS